MIGPTTDRTDDIALIRRIDEIGARIDARWREALSAGDFTELERCTAASQALHKASLALRGDALVGV